MSVTHRRIGWSSCGLAAVVFASAVLLSGQSAPAQVCTYTPVPDPHCYVDVFVFDRSGSMNASVTLPAGTCIPPGAGTRCELSQLVAKCEAANVLAGAGFVTSPPISGDHYTSVYEFFGGTASSSSCAISPTVQPVTKPPMAGEPAVFGPSGTLWYKNDHLNPVSLTVGTMDIPGTAGATSAANLSRCGGATPLAQAIERVLADLAVDFPGLPAGRCRIHIYSDGDENSSLAGTFGLPGCPYPTHHAVSGTCCPGLSIPLFPCTDPFVPPVPGVDTWQQRVCDALDGRGVLIARNFGSLTDGVGSSFLRWAATFTGGSYLDISDTNPALPQTLAHLGWGGTDSNGITLRVMDRGAPRIGQTFELSMYTSPQTTYQLAIGFSNSVGSPTSPAGPVSLPLSLAPLGFFGPQQLFTSWDFELGPLAAGTWTGITLPFVPALIGQTYYVQGYRIDTGGQAPGGFVFSDLLTLTIAP